MALWAESILRAISLTPLNYRIEPPTHVNPNKPAAHNFLDTVLKVVTLFDHSGILNGVTAKYNWGSTTVFSVQQRLPRTYCKLVYLLASQPSPPPPPAPNGVWGSKQGFGGYCRPQKIWLVLQKHSVVVSFLPVDCVIMVYSPHKVLSALTLCNSLGIIKPTM